MRRVVVLAPRAVSAAIAYCGLDVGISYHRCGRGLGRAKGGQPAHRRARRKARSGRLAMLVRARGAPAGELVLAATGVGSRPLGGPRLRIPGPPRLRDHRHRPRRDRPRRGQRKRWSRRSVRGPRWYRSAARRSRTSSPGNGVGGGTLLGLCRALLGTDDLAELGAVGEPAETADVSTLPSAKRLAVRLGTLPEDGTAANFAKYASRRVRAKTSPHRC